MRYLPPYEGVGWRHRVLGTYEAEIHAAIERVIERGFNRVLNIGAAEGYYTVGFALRLPKAQVFSFELVDAKRMLSDELAAMNGVSDRITSAGGCGVAELSEHLSTDPKQTFVFMDVDGSEWELLDPVGIPALHKTTILVELHDGFRPGVTEEIRRRFQDSHGITEVHERGRQPSDLPFAGGFLTPWFMTFMSESRPFHHVWFLMSPK